MLTKQFDHKGTWKKKCNSVMNPGSLVTWPQLIMEMIMENRIRLIGKFKNIHKGPGWHGPIQSIVGRLAQHTTKLTEYFPHPDQEPLVELAFRNVITNYTVMAVGTFRKTDVITKQERDFVNSVEYELSRLIGIRDSVKQTAVVPEPPRNPTFRTTSSKQITLEELDQLSNE